MRSTVVAVKQLSWLKSIGSFPDTLVRPDVVVLCGDAPERHVESAPAIVAEVTSESSRQRDREAKFELYQESSAAHYLIIDPDEQTLQAFSLDEHGIDQPIETDRNVKLSICEACELVFDVTKLFT